MSRRRNWLDELQDDVERAGLLDVAVMVANAHSVTVAEMLGPSHKPAPTKARRVLWAVLYMQSKRSDGRLWTYEVLGELFRRDHKTILAGVEKVSRNETRRFAEGKAA